MVVREFSGEKSMREAFEQLIERQTCEHFEEWLEPVSYTHLDVYKRQEEFSCLEFIMNRDTINWILKKLNTGGRTWNLSLIHILLWPSRKDCQGWAPDRHSYRTRGDVGTVQPVQALSLIHISSIFIWAIHLQCEWGLKLVKYKTDINIGYGYHTRELSLIHIYHTLCLTAMIRL